MGNNSAYTNFESLTVGLYNKGLLNKEILSSIMEQYRGTDIDSGGSMDLVSDDGLEVVEIVVRTLGKEVPQRPDVPYSFQNRTQEEQELYDNYMDTIYESFYDIKSNQFGWC